MTKPGAMPFHALILAGGRSTRMGRDKAMLTFSGQPLLERQVHLMRSMGACSVRVSGDYPGHQGIRDLRPGLGPLGGLYSAWPEPDQQCWLVLPVDLPRLGAAQLWPLLTALSEHPAACFHGHALPLALRLNPSAHSTLRQLVEDESDPAQRSLKRLLAMIGGSELALDADTAAHLINCNTPAEWQQAQQ